MGGSQVHNNATAWPNLGLLDSNKLDSKLGPSVAINKKKVRLKIFHLKKIQHLNIELTLYCNKGSYFLTIFIYQNIHRY